MSHASRDRLVVRTLRCGRSNPGSNPGHGMPRKIFFFSTQSMDVYFLFGYAKPVQGLKSLKKLPVAAVGFEPTPPKRLVP